MESLETELERARDLDTAALADAVESIGFECTRCGACCKGETTADGDAEPHTATVFPDEVRRLREAGEPSGDGSRERPRGETARRSRSSEDSRELSRSETPRNSRSPDGLREWRDVARPMPYGLTDGDDGPEGETFEWALQTDACGDCVFYAEDDGVGACTVHDDRPLICETYPFSVALGGTSQPMGETVDSVALEAQRGAGEPDDGDVTVRAHECEGLGRDIARADAEELARALKERAVRELEEAIGVRDGYDPVETGPGEVVVHDSEGAKRPDGTPVDASERGPD